MPEYSWEAGMVLDEDIWSLELVANRFLPDETSLDKLVIGFKFKEAGKINNDGFRAAVDLFDPHNALGGDPLRYVPYDPLGLKSAR